MRVLVRNRPPTAEDAPAVRPSEASDQGLVALAQADPRVFALLYRRFFDQVYWYCFGRLGESASAEDATSQVFANVFAALPRFAAGEASFRSWLFRIAHNVVIDEVRERHPHESLMTAVDLETTGPTPEDEAITEERHRLLKGLLTHLPDDQRRVVELRLAGLSSAEIGEVLGRRPGAVDTALWRAVTRLRSLIESIEPTEEGRDATR